MEDEGGAGEAQGQGQGASAVSIRAWLAGALNRAWAWAWAWGAEGRGRGRRSDKCLQVTSISLRRAMLLGSEKRQDSAVSSQRHLAQAARAPPQPQRSLDRSGSSSSAYLHSITL